MKEGLVNNLSVFLEKIWNFIKKCLYTIFKVINDSYKRCRGGEENLNKLLIYWNIIPCILYFIIIFNFNLSHFYKNLLDLFIILLGFLDIFFIQKALKKHPEYNTQLVKEYEKEQYYSSLSPEDLKKAKEEEKKENRKDFLKKILLMKPGEKIDSYKIVRMFTVLTILIGLKRILL